MFVDTSFEKSAKVIKFAHGFSALDGLAEQSFVRKGARMDGLITWIAKKQAARAYDAIAAPCEQVSAVLKDLNDLHFRSS